MILVLIIYASIKGTFFGFCPPGFSKITSIPTGDSYCTSTYKLEKPSKYNGQSCTKQSTCGDGTCYLEETGEDATCSDQIKGGQQRYYDENGDIKSQFIVF